MTSKTAVLFLVFNRPDKTARVFDAIRRARPLRLYVAADGPRADRPSEAALCDEVRRIVTEVDWPCEVRTLFRIENLGCGYAVRSAINWFFEHEPEGIILEDDCLPHPSFFAYCGSVLERYRDDENVMSVSGSCFARPLFGRASYGFTYYADMWGWATWRRSWMDYDADMSTWTAQAASWLDERMDEPEYRYWAAIFDRMKRRDDTIWDYQWIWTVISREGLVVTPYQNMIENIGFGADSTHTDNPNWHLKDRRLEGVTLPLIHPDARTRDPALERQLGIMRFNLSRNTLNRKIVAAWADLTTYGGNMFVKARLVDLGRRLVHKR